MIKGSKKILQLILVPAVILLIWGLLCRMGVFSAFVLPGPDRVWKTFISMTASGELFKNVLVSVERVLIGFAISFVLAFVLGVLSCLNPNAKNYYRPTLEFMRHIPPMSLIPLLILWFGIGETPKIIVIVLTAFFPIFMNTEAGLLGCNPKLLEVGDVLHMGKWATFFQIRLPAAVPDILVGMQIGLGYSFRAIVGAEMIAAAAGLGYMIQDAQAMARADKMLVGIIMIGILGILTDVIFKFVMHRLLKERFHFK